MATCRVNLRLEFGLSDRERAEIATRLIESLDSACDNTDDSIEQAWAAEIERRCAALDAGTTGTTDWAEVRRRIETEILRKRPIHLTKRGISSWIPASAGVTRSEEPPKKVSDNSFQ